MLSAHFMGSFSTQESERPRFNNQGGLIYCFNSGEKIKKANSQCYNLALDLSDRNEGPLLRPNLVWHALVTNEDGSRTNVGSPTDLYF